MPDNLQSDLKREIQDVEIKLLRALALGGKRSVEIQLLLDSQRDGKADYQALSLVLADLSVHGPRAKATFERLQAHQNSLAEKLGRPVGIKTAALDYLENVERVLNLRDDEHALTYTQLAQMAFRDHLTGLSNYRYFLRRYGEEVKRAGRYGHLLSVLMLDLDHFKKFNDTYGHPAGNKALEHLSSILQEEARETDIVARYGGEEFVVILPETTKYEAREVAERIRHRTATTQVDIPGGQAQLTLSIGLATFPRDVHDAESLLNAADAALYAAKNAGRNRTMLFMPQTSAELSYHPEHTNSVQSISAVGDFNGWNKNADPMHPDSDGTFRIKLHLAPGKYAYKFVINGEFYIHDPQSTQYKQDGYGGRNSILVVKRPETMTLPGM